MRYERRGGAGGGGVHSFLPALNYSHLSVYLSPSGEKKKKERKKRANSLINARLADEQDIPHVGVRTRTRDTYTNIYTSAHLLLKIAKGKISSLFSINSVCVRERETCTS